MHKNLGEILVNNPNPDDFEAFHVAYRTLERVAGQEMDRTAEHDSWQ
jgi:hypothetical protein